MTDQSHRHHQKVGPSSASAVSAADERERLIMALLPSVKHHAFRAAARIPFPIEIDDLIHAGILGLLDALEKYDPSRGTLLKTYAEIRIRGAIMDELRSMDWVPRAARRKMKRLQQAYAELEQELNRSPSEEEVADHLEMEIDELQNWLAEMGSLGVVKLEDLVSHESCEGLQPLILVESADPHTRFTLKEMHARIRDALSCLTERERLVVSLYYQEDLTLKEVGMVLGVTESRVSQIHSHILLKLRSHLQARSCRNLTPEASQ